MISAFEPMTGDRRLARRQIIELRQTGRVSGYIQRFRTLRYKIPSMTEEEAHFLFLREVGCRASAASWSTCTIAARSHGAGRLRVIDLYSKQAASGSSSSGQKQKTADKSNKKGWRGKGSWGAGPSKGSASHIEESTVSAAIST